MFHLYEVPRVVKFMEIKSTIVVAGVRKEGKMESFLFNRYKVSVKEDEKVLEMGGPMTVNILNATELYTKNNS